MLDLQQLQDRRQLLQKLASCFSPKKSRTTSTHAKRQSVGFDKMLPTRVTIKSIDGLHSVVILSPVPEMPPSPSHGAFTSNNGTQQQNQRGLANSLEHL